MAGYAFWDCCHSDIEHVISLAHECIALRTSPVESHDANERLLELLVGERVAERVDGAVEVADPVRDVVERRSDGAGQRAVLAREPDDQRQDVPRDPADHERAEDDGDGAQSLAGPVVAARQLLQPLPFRISRHRHNKAVVDIRLRPRCALPSPPSRPIGRIACAQNCPDWYFFACLAY